MRSPVKSPVSSSSVMHTAIPSAACRVSAEGAGCAGGALALLCRGAAAASLCSAAGPVLPGRAAMACVLASPASPARAAGPLCRAAECSRSGCGPSAAPGPPAEPDRHRLGPDADGHPAVPARARRQHLPALRAAQPAPRAAAAAEPAGAPPAAPAAPAVGRPGCPARARLLCARPALSVGRGPDAVPAGGVTGCGSAWALATRVAGAAAARRWRRAGSVGGAGAPTRLSARRS